MAVKRRLKASILDPGSFDEMIESIEAYSNGLKDAVKAAREELATRARDETEETYSSWPYFDVRVEGKGIDASDTPVFSIMLTHDDTKETSTVWSTDRDAMFLEFGAGSRMNTSVGSSSHPNPGQALIGSYPSPTARANAARGKWHVPGGGLTTGTMASCGMYNAAWAADENAEQVLRREVGKI